MDDLRDLALRLLEREPPAGPVLAPRTYRPGALTTLVEALACPETPADGPALVNLCLKYAQAYIDLKRADQDVSLEALTVLAGQFARRRGGCQALRGQDSLRRLLLHHGFALQMLFDLPKTVHLLSALLALPVPDATEGPFLGLDLGAGTGILLLGQYLLAKRHGYPGPQLVGIEHLPSVADRANALLETLGVGRVLCADATRVETYSPLAPGPVTCVTNETLPSAGRRLYKEPFGDISAALFSCLGTRLEKTLFFPETVWASDRTGESWLRLEHENAFAAEAAGKPLRLYFMRDVELAGARFPVHQVGQPFAGLVPRPWREALGRRW